MPQDWNGVTSADLRRRIKETQEDLERLVSDRRLVRRDLPERDAIAYAYDLSIYAANSRVETCAFLFGKLEVPAAHHVWDRYLIVYLHAAMEAYPRLASKVIREFRRLHDADHMIVDADRVTLGYKAYKGGVKQITDDRIFMEELERVRNTVGAHHLTAPNNGIDGLIEWIASKPDRQQASSDRLVMNTLKWSRRSMQFGREALGALNMLSMPPIPQRDEYRRLVVELDRKAEPRA